MKRVLTIFLMMIVMCGCATSSRISKLQGLRQEKTTVLKEMSNIQRYLDDVMPRMYPGVKPTDAKTLDPKKCPNLAFLIERFRALTVRHEAVGAKISELETLLSKNSP